MYMWASRGLIPSLESNWLVCATSRKHASREPPCLVRVWGHTPADERSSGGEIPGPRPGHSIPGKVPCAARKDAPALEAVVAWPVWPLPAVKEFSFRTLGLCAMQRFSCPPTHTHTQHLGPAEEHFHRQLHVIPVAHVNTSRAGVPYLTYWKFLPIQRPQSFR